MSKKYDTNPLDPKFPEKARATREQPVHDDNRETAKVAPAADTEEPTQYHQKRDFSPYPPPSPPENAYTNFDNMQFERGEPANLYKTAKLDVGKTSSRKVAKVGLPENILVALPYVPFYVGLIAGILELVFVPKSEAKVRFHAAQGLAAHLGILLITTVLGGIGNITDLAGVGNAIFQVVTMVMLIVWTIKAWQGKPVHIESVDDLTEWLEDKIKPQG